MTTHAWQEQFRRTAYSWLLGDFPPEQFPVVAIIPFENPDLFDPEPLASKLTNKTKVGSFIIGQHKNISVAISSPKFGAPAVAMAIDVLGLTDVQKIIGIGYCGRLTGDMKCGDLIIHTASFIDEGTSHLYKNNQNIVSADSFMIQKFLQKAMHLGVRVHSGPIWSTDGILRESEDKIRSFRAKGAIAVDMESSAAFTVGAFFHKHVASVLVCSDNPVTNEQADLNGLRRGYGQAIHLALETIASS